MEPKDRLQLRTPNTTFNYTSGTDSIVINSTIRDDTDSAEHEVKEEKKIHRIIEWTRDILKMYGLHITIAILIYLAFKPDRTNDLLEELEILRIENKELRNRQTSFSIATLDQGAKIYTGTVPYRYGFLKTRIPFPESILMDDNTCYGFYGCEGIFEICLQEPRTITGIILYHPSFGNSKSAIKEFEIYIDSMHAGVFKYSGHSTETFKLNHTGKNIQIRVKNNHGETKYTSIYRIGVIGF